MLRDRRGIGALASLTALLTLVNLPSARTAEITDRTPCTALIAAMDSENRANIRTFMLYVLNTMDDLDIQHTQAGEPGIMSQLSDEGRLNMSAMTSVNCRNHVKMTVYNSAALVYRGIRDMQLQLGTAK
jgi:NADP-dependent 3-hydroxy acid dehydrogenase YdfG